MNLKTSFENKNVLITGASGFKGAWLCEILLSLNANVFGYALAPLQNSLFENAKLNNKINFKQADIRDLNTLINFTKQTNPDYVIHMAAQPLVIDSYKNPVYTYDVNVMGTVNILESLRNINKKVSFLNVTTDKVYENDESGKVFTENNRLNGKDPYANSKSCSELVTSSYKYSFLENSLISTARAGNVIGGGDISENRIIPDCIRAIIFNEDVHLRNPKSIRPYQHVLEPLYVYLLILAMQYDDKKYEGSYNIAPELEDCIMTEELVKLFKKHYIGDFNYIIESSNIANEKESHLLRLSNEKIKKTFAWEPLMNIDTAVFETVDFFKKQQDGMEVQKIMDEQINKYLSNK